MAFSLRQTLAGALLALAIPLGASPVSAAELVMVEQDGCGYCREWHRALGPIYPKTPEGQFAPLRQVDKADVDEAGVALARPVVYTPTFLLVDGATEIGRIEGYPGEDFFWAMLKMMLMAKTDYDPRNDPNG